MARTRSSTEASPREDARILPGHPQRQSFTIGKYEIVAQPIAGSAHMLRYTVYVNRKRIGAMASMPTESDCKYLESPPPVPPLKPYYVSGRPGRPAKATVAARAASQENANEDL